jgi:hypothetical protein
MEQTPPGAVPEILPGELHLFGFQRSPAEVIIVRHSQATRLRHGLLALAKFWGVGLLCVLIPIAHFVLVPSFFILGIVMAITRFGEGASVVRVSGVCPRCAAPRVFEASGRLRGHLKVVCPECRNELDVAVVERV